MNAALQKAAKGPPSRTAPAADRIKILLAEDTPADVELLRGLLALVRPMSYDLIHAPTLDRALKRLARGGVDVILLDLNLPDSSGIWTALKVRAAAPEVPLIIMTGMESKDMAVQAVHQGAQDYLIKADIDSHMLERSIRYAIERQRLMAEAGEKYQKELELGRMKTRLVSVVSHEFANALCVIQVASDSLKEGDGQGVSQSRRRLYELLEKNVCSLNLTAKTLLNMGRVEAGKFILRLRQTNAGSLLKACADRLEILYQRKNIRVVLELGRAPIAVKADPEALSFVIANLFSNAIKYTPEGGSILLGAGPDPARRDSARIYIQDTGIGIPKEDQEKIFTDYYRTEVGKEMAEGFGVGLTFAKTILEAHGSSLKVKSAPGKGSRFFFTLPVWSNGASA